MTHLEHARRVRTQPVLILSVLLATLAACGDDAEQPLEQFESDLPDQLRYRDRPSEGDGMFAPPESADPARMIEEADVVQVAEGRLFALSRYGGLHVVAVQASGELEWLGSHRAAAGAEPFEMYLRDGTAFVLYRGYGRYEAAESGDGYVWAQSSRLLVLDVNDPSSIEEFASFSVPGAISDSRIVGEVLYVVSYQNGSCWGCESNEPLTSIMSLDLSDPSDVVLADELQYEDDDNAWGWNHRSIQVTTERMYVAGIEYDAGEPLGSSIHVIDISDRSGVLAEAAVVQAEGQISSRWQMDEYEGVLRVVSQPPAWDVSQPPVVQTFTIESSRQITPLGRSELVLPRPEQLQSVRFDGDRAYAITAQRTDPLFIIDLSDPAEPTQRGSLELPGFVYYMEPRGDRVIGLGFDQGNAQGAITVSLFDVSDLDQPTMLSRVNFGGSWASLPEDQDRIHKVFRVADTEGLILVPHMGWSDESCNGAKSGVQLIDYDAEADTITRRGAIPVHGEARRAFISDGELLTMSDERVESFDLADHDAPAKLDTVALTRNVGQMVPLASGVVARISHEFWNENSLRVDFSDPDEVENPEPAAGELELGQLVGPDGDTCSAYVWLQDAFAMGDRLLLAYRAEQWGTPETKASVAGLLVIDASDPERPEVLSNIDWSLQDGYWWFGNFYDYSLPGVRSAITHTEDAVAILESTYRDGQSVRRLRVIDLRDAEEPAVTTVALEAVTGQGGLLVDGTTVITSHYEEADDGAARFYIDRFDLSDPAKPLTLSPINVPGSVLWANLKAGRAVTADLVRQPAEQLDYQECFERFAVHEYEWNGSTGDGGAVSDGGAAIVDAGTVEPVAGESGDTPVESGSGFGADEQATVQGTCIGYRQQLHLLSLSGGSARLLDSYDIEESEALRAQSVGDGVLFATLGQGAYYGWEIAIDCFGPCGYYPREPSTLLALSGLEEDAFEAGTVEVDADAWWGWWSATPVYAVGKYALVVGQDDVLVVDGTVPGQPVVERTEPLGGYVEHVSTTDHAAFLSLGQYGGRRIELAPAR